MDIIKFIIAAFATYRITQLIVYDRGLFNVFQWFRGWTKKIALEHKVFDGLAFMVTCPFCMGIWMAFLCAILLLFPSVLGDLFLVAFGLAGVQSVIERFTV
jgi:hypothetical protein